jgi:hypothetical protein
MLALREDSSARRSESVWWREVSVARSVAASKVGERKALRGSGSGKGRSPSLSSEWVEAVGGVSSWEALVGTVERVRIAYGKFRGHSFAAACLEVSRI